MKLKNAIFKLHSWGWFFFDLLGINFPSQRGGSVYIDSPLTAKTY